VVYFGNRSGFLAAWVNWQYRRKSNSLIARRRGDSVSFSAFIWAQANGLKTSAM
jgi:hypothetical protein